MKKSYVFKNLQRFFSLENKKNLKEFYRAIHPDILQTAPKKVKEENTRSLKLLNNYLDTLENNKRTKNVFLKFYIPEKSNKKSKKFLFFETELESLNTENSEEISQIYYTKAIKKLITNMKATQINHNPMKDKLPKKEKVNFEDPDVYIRENPELTIKSSSKLEEYKKLQNFNKKFNQHEKNKQKEIVMYNIKRNLFLHYNTLDPTEKVKEEIYSDLTSTSLQKKMEELNLDPKIYFISENVFDLEDQIFDFFIELLKKLRNKEFAYQYERLQDIFLAKDPKLKIMLNNKKNITPGFVSININDSIEDSLFYIGENYQEAFEMRVKKIREKSKLKQFKEDLERNYHLKFIKLIGETDIVKFEKYHTKQFLFLTKLETLIKEINKKYFFLLKDFKIFISEGSDELISNEKKLYLRWNFDLAKIITLLKDNLLIDKENFK